MIPVQCPQCGQAGQVADWLAGLSRVCPKCSKSMTVPHRDASSSAAIAVTAAQQKQTLPSGTAVDSAVAPGPAASAPSGTLAAPAVPAPNPVTSSKPTAATAAAPGPAATSGTPLSAASGTDRPQSAEPPETEKATIRKNYLHLMEHALWGATALKHGVRLDAHSEPIWDPENLGRLRSAMEEMKVFVSNFETPTPQLTETQRKLQEDVDARNREEAANRAQHQKDLAEARSGKSNGLMGRLRSWFRPEKPPHAGESAQIALIFSDRDRYDFQAAKAQVTAELKSAGYPLAPEFRCEHFGIESATRDKRSFTVATLSKALPDRFPLESTLQTKEQRIALFPFQSKDGAEGILAVYFIAPPPAPKPPPASPRSAASATSSASTTAAVSAPPLISADDTLDDLSKQFQALPQEPNAMTRTMVMVLGATAKVLPMVAFAEEADRPGGALENTRKTVNSAAGMLGEGHMAVILVRKMLAVIERDRQAHKANATAHAVSPAPAPAGSVPLTGKSGAEPIEQRRDLPEEMSSRPPKSTVTPAASPAEQQPRSAESSQPPSTETERLPTGNPTTASVGPSTPKAPAADFPPETDASREAAFVERRAQLLTALNGFRADTTRFAVREETAEITSLLRQFPESRAAVPMRQQILGDLRTYPLWEAATLAIKSYVPWKADYMSPADCVQMSKALLSVADYVLRRLGNHAVPTTAPTRATESRAATPQTSSPSPSSGPDVKPATVTAPTPPAPSASSAPTTTSPPKVDVPLPSAPAQTAVAPGAKVQKFGTFGLTVVTPEPVTFVTGLSFDGTTSYRLHVVTTQGVARVLTCGGGGTTPPHAVEALSAGEAFVVVDSPCGRSWQVRIDPKTRRVSLTPQSQGVGKTVLLSASTFEAMIDSVSNAGEARTALRAIADQIHQRPQMASDAAMLRQIAADPDDRLIMSLWNRQSPNLRKLGSESTPPPADPIIEGHTKYDAGDHRGAIAAFERALALPGLSDKSIAGIYMNRGNSHHSLGDYRSAVADWQRIAGLGQVPQQLRDAALYNIAKCNREHPEQIPITETVDTVTRPAAVEASSSAADSPAPHFIPLINSMKAFQIRFYPANLADSSEFRRTISLMKGNAEFASQEQATRRNTATGRPALDHDKIHAMILKACTGWPEDVLVAMRGVFAFGTGEHDLAYRCASLALEQQKQCLLARQLMALLSDPTEHRIRARDSASEEAILAKQMAGAGEPGTQLVMAQMANFLS